MSGYAMDPLRHVTWPCPAEVDRVVRYSHPVELRGRRRDDDPKHKLLLDPNHRSCAKMLDFDLAFDLFGS